MSKFIYYLFRAGVWLLAIMPFRLMYLFSDILYLLVYRLIGYRKKVVRTNLHNSFPQKTEKERRHIEHKFYHHFCDSLLNSLKLIGFSKKELHKRMKFHNMDLYLGLIEQHGGIVVMMSHYANYEWVPGVGSFMKPGDIPVQVYRPIKNRYIDQLFQEVRSRFGGYNVPKDNAIREIIHLKHAGKKMALGLIADQSPNGRAIHYWTNFLNQETTFLNGGERIAKMMNFPVVYCDTKFVKRGYGEVYFELMTDTPKLTSDNEITEMYARRLEQTIQNEPAYWLWTHKRWKHKREE